MRPCLKKPEPKIHPKPNRCPLNCVIREATRWLHCLWGHCEVLSASNTGLPLVSFTLPDLSRTISSFSGPWHRAVSFPASLPHFLLPYLPLSQSFPTFSLIFWMSRGGQEQFGHKKWKVAGRYLTQLSGEKVYFGSGWLQGRHDTVECHAGRMCSPHGSQE